MTHEIDLTSTNPDTTVVADPDVPGRYKVTTTRQVTRTTVVETVVDVTVKDLPDPPAPPEEEGREVVFGYNAASGKVDGLQKMIDTYGPPAVCRVFSSPGKGIMSWDAPLLELLPDDCILVYSWKDWPLGEDIFKNWMTSKPAGRFPKVYWCLDHEPEQGPNAGDPTPDAYRQQWAEVLNIHNAHPRRDEFYPTPIFTEYYARKYRDTPNPATKDNWFNDFGQVLGFHGVEAVGFDVYDNRGQTFRTAQERNELPLFYAKMMNLPLLICEWGIAEKPEEDTDGSRAARAIRDNVNYLRGTVEQDVPYVMWFHNDEWSLDGRPKSQAAFVQAVNDNP